MLTSFSILLRLGKMLTARFLSNTGILIAITLPLICRPRRAPHFDYDDDFHHRRFLQWQADAGAAARVTWNWRELRRQI